MRRERGRKRKKERRRERRKESKKGRKEGRKRERKKERNCLFDLLPKPVRLECAKLIVLLTYKNV